MFYEVGNEPIVQIIVLQKKNASFQSLHKENTSHMPEGSSSYLKQDGHWQNNIGRHTKTFPNSVNIYIKIFLIALVGNYRIFIYKFYMI